MKRTALALILALLFSAVIACCVSLASANWMFPIPPLPLEPNKDPPTLIVQTPQDGDAYNVNTVDVNFTVAEPASWLINGTVIGTYSVKMYIDGKQLNSSSFTASHYSSDIDNLVEIISVVFYNLTRGGHSVKTDVRPTTFYNPYYPTHPPSGKGYGIYRLDNVSQTVHFVVNADPPKVSILSPANENYTSTDVPLNIIMNRPFSQITYSLDGHDNIAIGGNITLTGLRYGFHSLTLHVVDTSGNTGDYGTFTFSVVKPEPFPTTIFILAYIASVAAIVSLGLLVYFKTRKH